MIDRVRPYPGYPDNPTWKLPLYTTATRPRPPEAHYDPAASDIVVKFIRLVHHFKGEFGISPSYPTGRPFELLDWQLHELIRPFAGWKTLERQRDEDGAETDELIPCTASWAATSDGNLVVTGICTCPRLVRTLYGETPKKNGKTQLGAGIGGYMAFGDHEPAAEVHCYAADKENAKLLFDAMSFGMFYEGNPFEPLGLKPYVRSIVRPDKHQKVEVRSAKARTKHGPNAHCVIFDELHAQPDRELWDATTTGVAARRQPLVAAFTTAGWDRNSICWEQHEYARRIAEGIFDDPRFLGVVYSMPEDADWTSPAEWHKCSPSLGVTVSEEFYEQKCDEAKQMPTQQNAFRQLFGSQWTQQAVRFIDLAKWDLNNEPVDVESLRKRHAQCYGGLDLAATTDLAAFGLLIPAADDTFDVLVHYFMPEANIIPREHRDRVPYRLWVEQGFITATPGDVIDYAFIKKDILACKAAFDLREISYDSWNATQFVQELDAERIKLRPFIQGYRSFNAPTKELLRLILEKRLRHGANPVLRWNVDSAAAITDASENVRLDKSKSTARIDGLIALIMALGAFMANPKVRRTSIYMRPDLRPGETSAESRSDNEEV